MDIHIDKDINQIYINMKINKITENTKNRVELEPRGTVDDND